MHLLRLCIIGLALFLGGGLVAGEKEKEKPPSVKELIKQLDDDVEAREEAIEGLVKNGKESLEEIGKVLSDSSVEVQTRLITVMEKLLERKETVEQAKKVYEKISKSNAAVNYKTAQKRAAEHFEGIIRRRRSKSSRVTTKPMFPGWFEDRFVVVTVLYLMGTKITDAGLKELGSLNSITYLILSFTKITDAGLKELGSLTSLTELDLRYTKITASGLKKLRKALPHCNILH